MKSYSGTVFQSSWQVETCPKCSGMGHYFDPRCVDEVCAHLGGEQIVDEVRSPEETAEAFKSGTSKTKKVVKRVDPVMPCPARPCPCPLGDGLRRELRELAAWQASRCYACREPLNEDGFCECGGGE